MRVIINQNAAASSQQIDCQFGINYVHDMDGWLRLYVHQENAGITHNQPLITDVSSINEKESWYFLNQAAEH
jgi:hypothetical protein